MDGHNSGSKRRYRITISVIIPVYNEERRINRTIRSVVELQEKANESLEVIVVDGNNGSTIDCIENQEVIKLTSDKGRAAQMNKGASIATGDILLFLHADTTLPDNGFEKIRAAIASGKYVGGAFNLLTKSLNIYMKYIYYTHYLRSRLSKLPYGDQAIFIRKDYFHRLGGYQEIPLMEDVELMKRIKKNKGKICILKERVRASTRRYEEEGYLHTLLRNNKLRFLYFFGVSPEKLVKWYPDTRRGKKTKPTGQ
ncbi:MAG: glycosyltransferase family 2 protein [bacterium]|nr:glycosyltransferase family 2 protein [bacterium]